MAEGRNGGMAEDITLGPTTESGETENIMRDAARAILENPDALLKNPVALKALGGFAKMLAGNDGDFSQKLATGKTDGQERMLEENQAGAFRALSVSSPPSRVQRFIEAYQSVPDSSQRGHHTPDAVVAPSKPSHPPHYPEDYGPAPTGTPFAACTRDGTSIQGTVTGGGENPASFEKVKGVAARAAGEAFDPRSGADVTLLEDKMRRGLGDPKAALQVTASTTNDPRCAGPG